MHPSSLSIQDFTYHLPEDRIATHPLSERDASRLLIYKNGHIAEDTYRNIAAHLPKNAFLFFNNTKVVEARLLFQKPSGGMIEIFCLEPHTQYPDITTAMLQKGKVWWNCLVGGAGKWKHGVVLEKKVLTGTNEITITAAIVERQPGSFTIELQWQPGQMSFAELLHIAGNVPLPPYIKRSVEEADKTRYQTIYAQQEGSVAAPTAGLHFTDAIFESLKVKNIQHDFVTLHVGAGTFKPVKADYMKDHEMHTEFIDVRIEAIENLLCNAGNIFCVGTTSLRTVESLYWMGVKLHLDDTIQPGELTLDQWEVYDALANVALSVSTALETLLKWMRRHTLERFVSQTKLLVAPGYRTELVAGLITNFHQPQSTLLLLVAALIGNEWKDIYQYAMEKGFRFLSYGDGCLLFTGTAETPA